MEKFLATYRKLNAENLALLGDIYTEEIRFIDPAHQIDGLDRLTAYFAALYRNIASIGFTFRHQQRSGADGYVQWQMAFSHPRLKSGRTITVPGASYLHFADCGKVDLHRDYYDLGGMLYEQLPLLGGIVTTLKRRIGA